MGAEVLALTFLRTLDFGKKRFSTAVVIFVLMIGDFHAQSSFGCTENNQFCVLLNETNQSL